MYLFGEVLGLMQLEFLWELAPLELAYGKFPFFEILSYSAAVAATRLSQLTAMGLVSSKFSCKSTPHPTW